MKTNLTAEQARTRNAELLDTFVRMADYAASNEVRAILISGDLFDTRHISAQARNTFLGTVNSHPDICFFYLPGNHEEDAFVSAVQEPPSNLKVFGEKWTVYHEAGIAIAGVSGTGISCDDISDAAVTCVDDYTDAPCTVPVMDPAYFNIVMMHGQIANYGSTGREDLIDLRALSGRNIDYLALGHIHSYREGVLPPKGVWCYPGCLEGRGFDECGDHGFVLLDIDPESRKCTRKFVPFARRRFFAPEVDVTGCRSTVEMMERVEDVLHSPDDSGTGNAGSGVSVTENAGNGLTAGHGVTGIDSSGFCGPAMGSPGPDDLVKIILTGQVACDCEKHPEQIAGHFSPACYFFSVEDDTKLSVDYRDFRLDASLKGEFVRTVEADASLSEEEKTEIIRCGILSLSGELAGF